MNFCSIKLGLVFHMNHLPADQQMIHVKRQAFFYSSLKTKMSKCVVVFSTLMIEVLWSTGIMFSSRGLNSKNLKLCCTEV